MSKKKNGAGLAGGFLAAAVASARMLPLEIEGLEFDAFVQQISARDFRLIRKEALREGADEADGGSAYDDEMLGLLIAGASLCDEDRNRIIPAGEEDSLSTLPLPVLRALQKAALGINDLHPDAKDDEDEAGN